MPQTWTTCGTQDSPGVSYTYDVAGIRDSKTVTTSSGTITYNYLTQNGQVVRQTWTALDHVSHVMDFIYDNNGKPYAFYYDGTLYYYITNLQGDVIRIIDTAGATICTYTYDAWGRLLNSSTNKIFKANPIRYRGYYYDTETGLYYLGSRYYDPVVKRFVNADSASLVTANSYGLTDKNLFSYCDNSPVSRRDDGGELWSELLTGVAVVAGITAVCALAVATAGISVSAVAVAGGGMALSALTTSTSLAALGVAGASMVISAASVYFAKKQKGIVHMTLIHIKGLIRKSKGEKEKTKIVKRRITNRGTIGEITSPQSLSIIRQPKNIRNSRRVRMGGENEYLDDDSVEKVHRRRCVRTPFGTAYAV